MSVVMRKKRCPECGFEYLDSEAVEVNIEDKTVKACPNCGYTNIKR